MDILGKLIETRKMRYISQSIMAGRLGITLTTMHRYEAKEREISFKLLESYANEVGFELKLMVKE